jgi:hypothetical protein
MFTNIENISNRNASLRSFFVADIQGTIDIFRLTLNLMLKKI